MVNCFSVEDQIALKSIHELSVPQEIWMNAQFPVFVTLTSTNMGKDILIDDSADDQTVFTIKQYISEDSVEWSEEEVNDKGFLLLQRDEKYEYDHRVGMQRGQIVQSPPLRGKRYFSYISLCNLALLLLFYADKMLKLMNQVFTVFANRRGQTGIQKR